jgi:hypothetical protein
VTTQEPIDRSKQIRVDRVFFGLDINEQHSAVIPGSTFDLVFAFILSGRRANSSLE